MKNSKKNNKYKILIVEDEILIADNIKRFLKKEGHQVVGIAINYEEAVLLYLEHSPDISILDIRLNGFKSGIDFANFIRQQKKQKPFIFLTSQMDKKSIKMAKKTYPAGYLSKPIHKESLYAAIEIAMYNFEMNTHDSNKISLFDGEKNYLVPMENILFLQSDHVYVSVNIQEATSILQRCSLKLMLDQLPDEQFIQTHRSFAINLQKVDHWDAEYVYIEKEAIPISRSRRKEVMTLLEGN